MFRAATSGTHSRRYSMRFSIDTPIAPVEKLMITSSPHSPRIASEIALKSSTSYDGVPSGLRAWMWIITPPSSTIRRASAAYSSGVYGIAGHWSRLASAPEMAQVRMTGSSTDTRWKLFHDHEVEHRGLEVDEHRHAEEHDDAPDHDLAEQVALLARHPHR